MLALGVSVQPICFEEFSDTKVQISINTDIASGVVFCVAVSLGKESEHIEYKHTEYQRRLLYFKVSNDGSVYLTAENESTIDIPAVVELVLKPLFQKIKLSAFSINRTASS